MLVVFVAATKILAVKVVSIQNGLPALLAHLPDPTYLSCLCPLQALFFVEEDFLAYKYVSSNPLLIDIYALKLDLQEHIICMHKHKVRNFSKAYAMLPVEQNQP